MQKNQASQFPNLEGRLGLFKAVVFRFVLNLFLSGENITIKVENLVLFSSCQRDDMTPQVIVELTDIQTLSACVLNPSLAIGEAYQSGKLRITKGELSGFLSVLLRAANKSRLYKILKYLNFYEKIKFSRDQRYGLSASKKQCPRTL